MTIKTPERRHLSLIFTHCSGAYVFNFEQVNAGWVRKQTGILRLSFNFIYIPKLKSWKVHIFLSKYFVSKLRVVLKKLQSATLRCRDISKGQISKKNFPWKSEWSNFVGWNWRHPKGKIDHKKIPKKTYEYILIHSWDIRLSFRGPLPFLGKRI